MRLVVAGTPQVAVPALEALNASAHEVVAVVTRPAAAAGRGRRVQLSPVAQWAAEHDVPVLSPQRPGEQEFLAALTELAPDCCPVIAYGALIPPSALSIPVHGWVNLHFSLLPAWRGAAPVQRAIMAGDEVTGASTFLIEAGLDTGPVYGVLTETIRPWDTSGALLDRLAEAGAGLLLATMDGIATATLQAVPQPGEGVSLAPKISAEEARVPWHRPAHVIDRLIRACTPAPGAWTTWRGERLGLGPVKPVLDPVPEGPLLPGQVRVLKKTVQAGTASGAVELGMVRPAGKREMPAIDWARGARPQPAELLGDPVAIQQESS